VYESVRRIHKPRTKELTDEHYQDYYNFDNAYLFPMHLIDTGDSQQCPSRDTVTAHETVPLV
jgi:hypothetical protein